MTMICLLALQPEAALGIVRELLELWQHCTAFHPICSSNPPPPPHPLPPPPRASVSLCMFPEAPRVLTHKYDSLEPVSLMATGRKQPATTCSAISAGTRLSRLMASSSKSSTLTAKKSSRLLRSSKIIRIPCFGSQALREGSPSFFCFLSPLFWGCWGLGAEA